MSNSRELDEVGQSEQQEQIDGSGGASAQSDLDLAWIDGESAIGKPEATSEVDERAMYKVASLEVPSVNRYEFLLPKGLVLGDIEVGVKPVFFISRH